jgi:threonine dehydrogenase-like Zn-dependent dehydrogenase
MAAQTNPQFQGWLGKTPESVQGKMEWGQFEPKKWTEDDVDIEISHCGICGSDLHSTFFHISNVIEDKTSSFDLAQQFFSMTSINSSGM